MYEIEPIFIIFPVFCLLFAILEKKSKPICVFTVSIAFILIYSLSLNGSDIISYRILYETVASPGNYNSVHGEIGFKLLMLLFNKLNADYVVFRVILLITVTIVLFYSIYKISPNFSLSVFFLTTMFVIYTISTYRQYIVFAFALFWLYRYSRGKELQALIGMGLLAFFHISALLMFGMLVLVWAFKKHAYKWCTNLSTKKIFIWIIAAVILRVLIIFAMNITAFRSLMSKITNGYSDDDIMFMSVGFLSRIVFLLGISYLMRIRKPQDALTKILFWLYFFGIIMHIVVPFTTFSGRLFNNFHILSIVLVPLLCKQKNKKNVSILNAKGIALKQGVILVILILVAVVILINQLLNQDGYTPYLNIILGDKLP